MNLANKLRMKKRGFTGAFVAAATSGSTLTGSGTVTLNVPTHANGDLLIVGITGDVVTSVTKPAGWSNEFISQVGTDQYLHVYSRVASSEPASYNWTLTDRRSSMFCASYRNVSTRIAPDGTIATQASTSYVASTISPAQPNMLLFIGQSGLGTATFTPPPGMTERVDVNQATLGCGAITLADQVVSAGSTGTRTATCSSANAGSCVLLALA